MCAFVCICLIASVVPICASMFKLVCLNSCMSMCAFEGAPVESKRACIRVHVYAQASECLCTHVYALMSVHACVR